MSDKKEKGRQPRGLLALRAVAMPKDTNPSGDIFGGWILAQMDVAGGKPRKISYNSEFLSKPGKAEMD